MKIIVTKEQFKLLAEDTWSYSPNKLSEFINAGSNDVASAKKFFQVSLNKISTLTISDINSDINSFKEALNKIKSNMDYLEKKKDKYYDIVEKYDEENSANNISELFKIANELDDILYSIGELHDCLDVLITNTEYLEKYLKQ